MSAWLGFSTNDAQASNHYTGCLNAQGQLSKVKTGNKPVSPCVNSKAVTLKGEVPGRTETIPFFLELPATAGIRPTALIAKNGPLELYAECGLVFNVGGFSTVFVLIKARSSEP
jgi:hypothetical protein